MTAAGGADVEVVGTGGVSGAAGGAATAGREGDGGSGVTPRDVVVGWGAGAIVDVEDGDAGGAPTSESGTPTEAATGGMVDEVVRPSTADVVVGVSRAVRTSDTVSAGGRRSVTSEETKPTPAHATPNAAVATSSQAATYVAGRVTLPSWSLRAHIHTKPSLSLGEGRPGDPPAAYGVEVASVLVIEDDQQIRAALARGLADAGHSVRAESTAAAGLTAVVDWQPDAIVLDLGLPDLDGRAALRMMRAVSQAPVIVASARDDERGIVEMLDHGADDYVVKPYTVAQIEARVRAVLRRGGSASTVSHELRIGDLVLDPARRTAVLADEQLELSRLEFDLLAHLARRSPEVVSRRELMAEVWRQPYGGGDKTVDVHISWLRRKLGETAAEPRFLHTVRGVGVKLEAPTR